MNTINLKFFTGCAASLTLLCSFAIFGCSGAENDISALQCFAGTCDEDDEKGHNDHYDPDYADPDNAWSDAMQQVTPDVLDFILDRLVIRDNVEMTESLASLRKQIDEMDDHLMDLLTKRMRVSREIAKYK